MRQPRLGWCLVGRSSTGYVPDLCVHYNLTRKTSIKERSQKCSSFPFYFLVLTRTKKETHKPFTDLVTITVTFDSLYFNPMCVPIYCLHCCRGDIRYLNTDQPPVPIIFAERNQLSPLWVGTDRL